MQLKQNFLGFLRQLLNLGVLMFGMLDSETFLAQQLNEERGVQWAAPEFATQRLKSQSAGMKVLAGWAAISIAAGAALSLGSSPKSKYAGYQSLGWGTVNAAIAGFALYNISNELDALDSLSRAPNALLQELGVEHSFSKLLLFNLGLDAGYMAVGTSLLILSRNRNASDALFGSGLGILIQGAFLFGFDLWHFLLSNARLGPLEDAIYTRLALMSSSLHDFGAMISFSF